MIINEFINNLHSLTNPARVSFTSSLVVITVDISLCKYRHLVFHGRERRRKDAEHLCVRVMCIITIPVVCMQTCVYLYTRQSHNSKYLLLCLSCSRTPTGNHGSLQTGYYGAAFLNWDGRGSRPHDN